MEESKYIEKELEDIKKRIYVLEGRWEKMIETLDLKFSAMTEKLDGTNKIVYIGMGIMLVVNVIVVPLMITGVEWLMFH